jgi:hypothetical protein
MAFMDFRSTWNDLLKDLHAGETHVPSQSDQAERVLHQVTEELGLVEPDLMVISEHQPRVPGRVVYDKFAVRRR